MFECRGHATRLLQTPALLPMVVRRRRAINEPGRQAMRWSLALAGALVASGLAMSACVVPAAEPSPSGTPASVAPSVEPTPAVEPSPSPTVTPGRLPGGLEDRTWFTRLADGSYVAGTLASGTRVPLPAGSLPLAASSGRVATVVVRGTDREPESTFSIITLGASAPPVSVTLKGFLGIGVFVGNELIVTGAGGDGLSDPGVLAIEVSSGATRTLIPEGPLPDGWKGLAASRTILASASGWTVVASLCGYGLDTCEATVLDLPGGTERSSLHVPGYPRPFQLGDGVLIFGPDPATTIGAMDLATGKELWSLGAKGFGYGYLTGGGSLVEERLLDDRGTLRFEIVVIDTATGALRTLFVVPPAEDLTLWPELSTDTVAVLGRDGRLVDAGGPSSVVELNTLDLATGRFTEGVFELALHD